MEFVCVWAGDQGCPVKAASFLWHSPSCLCPKPAIAASPWGWGSVTHRVPNHPCFPPCLPWVRSRNPSASQPGISCEEGGSRVSSDQVRSTRVCFIRCWKLPAPSFKTERELTYRNCILTRRTSFKSRSLAYLVIKIFFITTL